MHIQYLDTYMPASTHTFPFLSLVNLNTESASEPFFSVSMYSLCLRVAVVCKLGCSTENNGWQEQEADERKGWEAERR